MLTPTEAHVLSFTRRLLAQEGVHGWSVTLDNAKRRGGQCNYTTRTISLSRPLIKARPLEEALKTAKHEVAHALAGKEAGHGPEWKKIFIRLGGDGVRYFDSTKVNKDMVAKYRAICPNNDTHRYYKHRQIDDRTRRCSACPDHPVLTYYEIATGKPMQRYPYRSRRTQQFTSFWDAVDFAAQRGTSSADSR